jgi:Zn-finger nucleic acid-binding protein
MNCIDCSTPMTTSRCACGGAWLSEAKLVDMAQDMKGSLVVLPWSPRDSEHRACPVCAKEMLAVSLLEVELDRCPAHGVWFDANELGTVLERADKLPDAILDGPNVKLGHSNSAPAPTNSGGSGSGWFILGAIFDIIDIATD